MVALPATAPNSCRSRARVCMSGDSPQTAANAAAKVINSARPSSVGEILDRAIATYVRRFVPLFVIAAMVAIPISVLESLASPGFSHLIDTITALSRVPPGHPAETARIMREFQRGTGAAGPVALMYLAHILLGPLASTALIIFAAATLDDRPVTIGSAYRAAFARWIPQIVVGVTFLFIITAALVVVLLAASIVGFMIAGIYAAVHAAGIVLGILLGLIVFVALVVATATANVAWLMATVGVALEEPNPFRAVGRALRRALDGSLFRRTVAVAFAILAIEWFGTLVFLSFAAVVAFATHSDVVSAVISSTGGVVLTGVCMLLVLVYMRDVQLRREGADLLLLATDAPAPPV
jgi:hypothetical protein